MKEGEHPEIISIPVIKAKQNCSTHLVLRVDNPKSEGVISNFIYWSVRSLSEPINAAAIDRISQVPDLHRRVLTFKRQETMPLHQTGWPSALGSWLNLGGSSPSVPSCSCRTWAEVPAGFPSIWWAASPSRSVPAPSLHHPNLRRPSLTGCSTSSKQWKSKLPVLTMMCFFRAKTSRLTCGFFF